MKDKQHLIESIIWILSHADDKMLQIIYQFVLHAVR